MYIKINVDTIYADGTVHFEKESKYVTLDNQFTVLPDSFETKYIDDFDDGTKVTCKFLRLPFDYYVLNDVYEQKRNRIILYFKGDKTMVTPSWNLLGIFLICIVFFFNLQQIKRM